MPDLAEDIPDISLVVSTVPLTDQLPPDELANAIVRQLQGHQGCSEHTTGPHESHETPTIPLSNITSWPCPDVLSSEQIAQHPTDWQQAFPPPARRQVYTGRAPSSSENPRHIDVEADTVSDRGSLQQWIDIDSAGGFASSLAVARAGISWKVGRAAVSNLQSSLHLDSIHVWWTDPTTSRRRQTKRPLHQVPHLPFGRLMGFPEVELYILFPRLYMPFREHWVITQEEYTQWTNDVMLPALETVYPTAITQHLPSHAQHISLNGTAARTETRAQKTAPTDVPYTQDFHIPLQADQLGALWTEIQQRILAPGLVHFRDCHIVLTSKDLKLSTQRSTWAESRDLFFGRWNRAVDPTFLVQDFYDLAKEIVPSGTAENEPLPLTLSWRRCCLEEFSHWLTQVNIDCGVDEPAHSSSRSSSRTSAQHSANATDSSDRESDFDTSDRPDAESVDSDAHSPSPSPQPATLPFKREFYPQSLLRDHTSMTLAPTVKSNLWRSGLRYSQHYNASKNILAAGKIYPFQNQRLDTLALDPGMARTWQHVGGAVSHSPLTVLRAYLHTKQRSHVAFQGCRDRSYGTREEYRLTGHTLAAVDRRLRELGLDTVILPPPPAQTQPFYVYPTPMIIDWWRWNMNKLCVGFEMTYSLQPRTFVHWEHTRVMMMFLQCLLCTYGGQGNHFQRRVGLWIDRRTAPPQPGSDTEKVQEGMAIGQSLPQLGYAWLADKLDWTAMSFLPTHRPHMVFNTPSLQSTYHTRYQNVVRAKTDFLVFHDVYSYIQQHRDHPPRSALLLQLLIDLCLRAFRKEIFETLSRTQHHQPFHAEHMREACLGNVPLTGPGIRSVFLDGVIDDDLVLVLKPRNVTHVENLFAWLWGWDGDAAEGDWPRQGWEFKPFRIFYRQSYGWIAQMHGVQQARQWRVRLKQTWLRTHWVLPYPSKARFWSTGPGEKHYIWASHHAAVSTYYGPSPAVISLEDLPYLPVTGWERSSTLPPHNISLPPVPEDFESWLRVVGDSPPPVTPEVPLPAIGMLPGEISTLVEQQQPVQRRLRSFAHQQVIPDRRVHSHREWQTRHLIHHLKASAEAHRQQLTQLQQPEIMRARQHRSRPELHQGLAQVHLTLAHVEDEDSDPDSLRPRRTRLTRRIRQAQHRLQQAEAEITRLQHCEEITRWVRYIETHHLQDPNGKTLTKSEWDREIEIFKYARIEHTLAQQRLSRWSRQAATE